jgi:hypothetical protein
MPLCTTDRAAPESGLWQYGRVRLTLVLALLLAACLPIDLEGRPCDTSDDCIDGYRCANLECVSEESDTDSFASCDAALLPAGQCESDVVGSWFFDSACVGEDTTLPPPVTGLDQCPGLGVTALRTNVSGDLSLHADGSWNSGLRGDVEWQVDVPAACTGGVDCSIFELGVGDGSADCTADGDGGCTCLGLETEYSRFEPVGDSYAVSAGEVVLSGDTSFRLAVCRQGSSLMIAEVDGDDVGPTVLLRR